MLAVAGVIAVTGAAVVLWPRSEAEAMPVPLPVVTVQAHPEVELPYTAGVPSGCPSLSYRSPVESAAGTNIRLSSGSQRPSMFNVVCFPIDSFGSVDELVAWKMAHRVDSQLVGQPVWEVGAMGRSVRTELDMGSGTLITEWLAEREGKLVIAGYYHHADDPVGASDVADAMVASLEWR